MEPKNKRPMPSPAAKPISGYTSSSVETPWSLETSTKMVRRVTNTYTTTLWVNIITKNMGSKNTLNPDKADVNSAAFLSEISDDSEKGSSSKPF
ncbi:hypothetical protein NPIL_260001 [Nephila pilipes]|uniref:Uncharacterized protein n=1 Tax=Nephila pilipes TaxID=299642 RepID=A0A8X6MM19_NEPPI|nr:hypothetical protein NPIL_260001 [Nephila pilipes]